jgi:hypothetical protein
VIAYRSFTKRTGLTQKSILEKQVFIRREAEAFIQNELDDEQVVNISEAAVVIPAGMTCTVVSATVWYKM